MRFHPNALHPRDAILLVVPALVSATAKPARINREIFLHGPERASAVADQTFQDRGKVRVLKERRDFWTGDWFGDEAILVGLQQVSREPTRTETAVDLVGHRKHAVPDEMWLRGTEQQIRASFERKHGATWAFGRG